MGSPTTRIMEEREADLPLDTFHATISAINTLDRNRHAELEDALAEQVVERRDQRQEGSEVYEALDTVAELLGGSDDTRWDDIQEAVAGIDRVEDIGRKAELVRGREEQPYSSLMELRFLPGTDDDVPTIAKDQMGELLEDFFEGQEVATDGGEAAGEHIDYIPGQHFGTRVVFDAATAEKTGTRTTKANAYSISSTPDPSTNEISLLIKRIPPSVEKDSSMTPQLFDHAEEGDELVVHGPYTDDLMLHDPSPDDMVFMATGTGVAPLKSMIDYTFKEGWDEYEGEERDVWLFLGAKWADWLPYRDEFAEMAEEHDNFHFVPTLSREGEITDYDGADDYIQYEMLKYLDDDAVAADALDDEYAAWLNEEVPYDIDARIDPEESLFYLCGVTAMVQSVRPVFEELGIPESRYQAEPFG